MKDKFCGYVIDSIDYKDNDSIITVLSPNGLISLKARGTKKIASKMNSVLFNYAYSEFEVNKSEKSGYLTLLDGTLLNYPSYIVNSLEYMTLMGIISEGISKCSDAGYFYTNFKDCMKLMEDNVDSKLILIAFLNSLLESEGIKYVSDGCVDCGNKQVVSFDFTRGGFLCKNCSHENQNVEYLKTVRIMTKINFENIKKVNIKENDSLMYINQAFNSLENKCGIVFRGKEFLFRVYKMEE